MRASSRILLHTRVRHLKERGVDVRVDTLLIRLEDGEDRIVAYIVGVEGKVTDEDFYAALPDDQGEPVRLASTNPAENDDDDLRLALVKLKVIADNAGIPDEPFQLDIGDEVKKLVDRALAGK